MKSLNSGALMKQLEISLTVTTVALLVLAVSAPHYAVASHGFHQLPGAPFRGTELLNSDFFQRLRDMMVERAYEEAINEVANDANNLDDSDPVKPVDTSHLDSPPKPRVIENWPMVKHEFGQVTAVSINRDGNPVIFHRGHRVWDAESFNESNHYQKIAEGPIEESTVLTLSAETGEVIDESGSGIFFLPHGMTIDRNGNMWLTDVALHQAFKFMPGRDYPSITIGRRFEPGSSRHHLCKPTATAVATTGEVFIADGYCNSRLLKFNAAGRLIRTIPQPPEFLSLQVPHGLTLLEHLDLICVADRENMRVVCPRTKPS